jgi:site-specific DNA recombinase
VNCLLYARVSTDKQAQKDLSIPAQIDMMKEYANKNGWKITGHFVDQGESATTANRPELKRLLQHCKETKEVDAVIVHKIDRLARNLIDYATIKAILKQKGIKLISVSEPFDDNPVGHLLENIIASISEWYSANLGQEMKKSHYSKLKKGEWPTKAPIGYKGERKDNRTIHVPDENSAPQVRQVYELFSTGQYSLITMGQEMAERGIRTRTRKIYSPEQVKKLLSRRFYIGRLVWKGKEYQGKHQPIISEKLFYRVQEVLKKRSVDTGEKGKLEFLLRGTAYCQDCGRRLTGEVHPRGAYYRCFSGVNKKKCHQPYIPVQFLDDQLEDLYRRLQPSKKLLELLKMEMWDIAQKRTRIAEMEIGTLEKTIDDIEQKELKLLDEKVSGKVPQDVYESLEGKYREKKLSAEARLSQLDVDYKDPLDFLDKCIVISSSLLYLHQKFTFDQKKTLLKALFAKIVVRDKMIVGVELNPPFSILLREDLEKVFDNLPIGDPVKEVFEQLISFILSGNYPEMERLVGSIIENTGVCRNVLKPA